MVRKDLWNQESKTRNITRLIRRTLKAGIMEDYGYQESPRVPARKCVFAHPGKYLYALCTVMVV